MVILKHNAWWLKKTILTTEMLVKIEPKNALQNKTYKAWQDNTRSKKWSLYIRVMNKHTLKVAMIIHAK